MEVIVCVLDELLSRIRFDLGLLPKIFLQGVAVGANLVIFN